MQFRRMFSITAFPKRWAALAVCSVGALTLGAAEPAEAWVHARGPQLYAGETPLVLRGYNLGNWLLLEDFMIGLHGVDRQVREAAGSALGERAKIFWSAYERNYFGTSDARYLQSLGVNLLRVPLNQSRFEDPNRPGAYDESALQQLDRVIGLCKQHGIYVLIDVHAVFGGQSREVYADSPSARPEFWTYADLRRRATAFWVMLAKRYANEAAVAGYSLLNEPNTIGHPELLEAWNRETVAAIRAVDQRHMLWLMGDEWGKTLDGIPPELLDQEYIALETHWYPEFTVPRELKHYPGELKGVRYDHAWLRGFFAPWIEVSKKRPVMLGEFGLWWNSSREGLNRKVCEDYIAVAEEAGWSWAIWTYKDVGAMGLVSPKPGTPWKTFLTSPRIEELRGVASTLYPVRMDRARTGSTELQKTIERLGAGLPKTDYLGPVEQTTRAVTRELDGLLTRAILWNLHDRSDAELEALGASFAFENCAVNPGTAELFRPPARK